MILRGILRGIGGAIGVVGELIGALLGVGETLVAATLLGLLVVATVLLAVGPVLVLLPLFVIGVGIWVAYRIVSSERERGRYRPGAGPRPAGPVVASGYPVTRGALPSSLVLPLRAGRGQRARGTGGQARPDLNRYSGVMTPARRGEAERSNVSRNGSRMGTRHTFAWGVVPAPAAPPGDGSRGG